MKRDLRTRMHFIIVPGGAAEHRRVWCWELTPLESLSHRTCSLQEPIEDSKLTFRSVLIALEEQGREA